MNNIEYSIINRKQIIHLGPYVVDTKWAHNCYLLNVNDAFVLFDIAPLSKFDLFKQNLERYTSISHIKYIVLQYGHIDLVSVLVAFIKHGFKGTIITNYYFGSQIRSANLNIKVMDIEDLNLKLRFDNEQYLEFYPMSFLPFPQMFMTYSSIEKTFFTASILSSYYRDVAVTNDGLFKQIFQYHLENMPSTTYIKPMLEILMHTEHNEILPLFGYPLSLDIKALAIDYLYKNEFYNSNLYLNKYQPLEEIHITELINLSLTKLSKYFSTNEIIDLFKDSPFELQQNPLSLNKSTLHGYKMYHGFFDYIYAKKGLLWLSILEPTISKYVEVYKTEQPSIYKSLVLQMHIEKEMLETKKKELESNFNELQIQIEQIKENALRCPFTNLYYQNVLSETLVSELTKDKQHHSGLLLIQLDQLVEINKRYGKDIGNESIRNMAYTISGLLSNNQYIFKQYGPGIYLLDTHATKESLKAVTKLIKNSIRESSVFIEKLSVSITSVIEYEIDKSLSTLLQVNSFYDTLDKRMLLNSNSISNASDLEDLPQTKLSEGKILLVDEDEMNRNMLFRIFKRMHYEVILAQSVQEALELIKVYPIDIIISEINLSKIDGFKLKQMLNENDEYRHIPFIMVSHNKTLENIKRGNALDVDLMLAKPIIADELAGHIKRFKAKWMT